MATSSSLLFEKRREEYLSQKQALFSDYMQRKLEKSDTLFSCFSDATEAKITGVFSARELEKLLSKKVGRKHTGGYFFRWNQKGICINPTDGFFERFCQNGYHLWDIDIVIWTLETHSQELELIHQLNRELNQLLVKTELEPHLIHFFLHPAVFGHYAAHFRPQFREEQKCLVCLETFQDYSSHEEYPLGEGMTLLYASVNTRLCIRFQLDTHSFGYVTGTSWQSKCSEFFKGCNILLCGFGESSPEDLEGLGTDEQTVGYSGLIRALQELPDLQLLLVAEFGASQGDLRLEIIKKLKEQRNLPIFPLANSFVMDLKTLHIKTASGGEFTPLANVRVIRSEGAFGPLTYLEDTDVL